MPKLRSAPTGLLLDAARSLTWGALTLVDPKQVSGWRANAYWGALAAAAAAEAAFPPLPELDGTYVAEFETPTTRAALAVAAGSAIIALREPSTALDAWVVKQLRRRGVGKPRILLAAATTALTFTAYAAERKARSWDAEAEAPFPEPVPLDPRVRALTEAILESVSGFDNQTLLKQLELAQQYPESDTAAVEFEIPADAPRARLSYFTFPATATYQRHGRTFRIFLEIEEGQLRVLTQGTWGDQDVDLYHSPAWSWPDVSEVTITPGDALSPVE